MSDSTHSPAVREQRLIGMFDSGVGGLSILKALHERLPGAPLLYVADSANAPYGERSDTFIAERSERIAAHLLGQGASMLVVACNTATAVAVAALRGRWPAVPVVAVEPGLKPAVASSRNGRIGVMATPATLRSEKFLKLLEAHRGHADVRLMPCPGLAAMIEQGAEDPAGLAALLEGFCGPLRAHGVDTVVLGCTHYPFVSAQIQSAVGESVRLIATADAVGRQVARVFDSPAALHADGIRAPVRLQTTGGVDTLRRVAERWLDFDTTAESAQDL
jgi:glutamate racemase